MIFRRQILPEHAVYACSVCKQRILSKRRFLEPRDRDRPGDQKQRLAQCNGKGACRSASSHGTGTERHYPMISGTGERTPIYGRLKKFHSEQKSFNLYPADNWDFQVAQIICSMILENGKRQWCFPQSVNRGWKKTDLSQKGIAYQAIVMFESLINSEQITQAKSEDIANLKLHLDFVKKRLSTGSATQFDVLRSEVQLSNSQTEAIDLDNTKQKQCIDFRFFGADGKPNFCLKRVVRFHLTPVFE